MRRYIRFHRKKGSPRINKQPKSRRVEWEKAPDIQKRVAKLILILEMSWVRKNSIYCFRSRNSKTRAFARIWGFSRIWQLALETKPAYVIEVISERFDKLQLKDQDKVLLHELAHIPKTFSGSLVPHFRKGKRKFDDRVRELVKVYFKQ